MKIQIISFIAAFLTILIIDFISFSEWSSPRNSNFMMGVDSLNLTNVDAITLPFPYFFSTNNFENPGVLLIWL